MKKRKVILLSIIIPILIIFQAVGIVYLFNKYELYYLFVRELLPETGVWHNDELRMDIVFGYLNSNGGDCVFVYSQDEDKVQKYNMSLWAKGNTVEINPIKDDGSIDGTKALLSGKYKYSDKTFTITSNDGTVYKFYEKNRYSEQQFQKKLPLRRESFIAKGIYYFENDDICHRFDVRLKPKELL